MSYENVWVAIIAGGKGTRLFPISHDECPKQFCQLDKDNTFIQKTVKRYVNCGARPEQTIIIVTSEAQKALAYKQTKWLGILDDNIVIVKPYYDFAGCMVLASEIIEEKTKYSPKSTIVINTPADQFIVEDDKFKEAINSGISNARAQRPTIIGVKVGDVPTMTGLGHASYKKTGLPLTRVENFIEKPSSEEAKKMLERGNTVANSGIGIWSVDTILSNFASSKISEEGLSTDKFIKQLIGKLDVIIADFEWYDCGTLKSLYDISPQTPNHHNATICGEVERINCRNSLFYAIKGVKIVASKIEDTAVVANAVNGKIFIAVVGMDQSQYVKELAWKYDNIKDLLLDELAIRAINNPVANINMMGEAYVGFIGKNNVIVTIYKQDDGKVVVYLKQTS